VPANRDSEGALNMRHRWTALTVAAVLAAAASAFLVAEPASAGLVTSCTGTASDVTVPNDLFVPAGESCELTNVVINGNTTVRAGANLVLNTSTLNGALTVQPDGFASAVHTTVTGATRLNTAFGTYTENSTFSNVTVTGSGFFYSLGSALNNVTSTNGETYLQSVRLAKNLATTGDLLTDVYNSVIQGTVSVTSANLGSVVCLSEIDGNSSFSGSGAGGGSILQVGASAPLTGCGFNVFAANVTLTGNVAPSYISDNVVRGSLTCTGNDPGPVGSSGRIRGQATGQCAAAPLTASSAAATTTVDTRAADILAKTKSRTSTGRTSAVKAGRAAVGR
jgi:hypothetical protein